MKAVVHDQYGPPDVLELRDVDPPAPSDDEVLVRVRAAGVDRGVWHLLTGRPYLVRVVALPLRPSRRPIRGWEFAGIAETAGEGVQPGDEVYGTCAGSFAEYACAEVAKIAPSRRTSASSRRPRCRSPGARRCRGCATAVSCAPGSAC